MPGEKQEAPGAIRIGGFFITVQNKKLRDRFLITHDYNNLKMKKQKSCLKTWKLKILILSLQKYPKKRKVMATAIRIIPTLQGEEAEKFLENAEWTEAHPGSIKVDKKKVELTRKFLREMNLL